MRLGIGVEFDDGLSRTDYCHGLYAGEKKRLEAVERADFVELGHSMGLSRRAAETRIDMLRDRVVAAFETLTGSRCLTIWPAASRTTPPYWTYSPEASPRAISLGTSKATC